MDNKTKNPFSLKERCFEETYEMCQKGISLVSLIITIIVMIIIVAIVIFKGFETSKTAKFSSYVSELDGIKEKYQDEFMREKVRFINDSGEVKTDYDIYSEIGMEMGLIDSVIDPSILSNKIAGKNCFKIDIEFDIYTSAEGIYITDAGDAFTLPGYKYRVNGELRHYINGNTYYLGEPVEVLDGIRVASMFKGDASNRTWDFLNDAANIISSDVSITNKNTSAVFNKDEKTYLIMAGDEFSVEYKGNIEPVIVLGFNYDDKASGGKAGITFGFKNILKTCEITDLITDYSLPVFVVMADGDDMLNDIAEATRNNIVLVTKNTTPEGSTMVSTNNYLWSLDSYEILTGNNQYAYYAARWNYMGSNLFASKSYDGISTNFWLRGSRLLQGGTNANLGIGQFNSELGNTTHMYITPNPKKQYVNETWVKDAFSEAVGIAPCFCIGK